MDRAYVETVRLLLEATPAVFRAPYFAMKGGTVACSPKVIQTL
jgi:hypothetical protein